MSAVIELINVSRIYGKAGESLPALSAATLRIEKGEFVAITGPSGSGKSTLMSLMGCLEYPSGGQLRISGHDVQTLTREQLADLRAGHLGFVFQQYNLLAPLTVSENILLPSVYSGRGEAAIARMNHLASALGIAGRLAYFPAELSGGQQQRVSIARALINDADIILADEPTGALDEESGRAVMDIFRQLNREGKTIVLVTHDPRIASYAGRQITMKDGRIVSDSGCSVSPEAGKKEEPAARSVQRSSLMYRLAETVRTAIRMLSTHRLRTVLSALGIIIGITSVVITHAVAEGARDKVLRQIEKLGPGVSEIRPGRSWTERIPGSDEKMTMADLESLRQMRGVAEGAPVLEIQESTNIRGKSVPVRVTGTTAEYRDLHALTMISGRFFTERENQQAAPVLVLDENELSLSGLKDISAAVGSMLEIRGIPFRIIGVVRTPGPVRYTGTLTAYIPLESVRQRITGFRPLTALHLSFDSDYERMHRATEQLMTARHGGKDFFIWRDSTLELTKNAASDSLALLIMLISGISLIVGGIGVMNILLLSVRERNVEIGIRQATGARPGDIMLQFLGESVILCSVATVISLLLSAVVVSVLNQAGLDYPMKMTPDIILIAGGVAFTVGMLSGWYPARRAALTEPAVVLKR